MIAPLLTAIVLLASSIAPAFAHLDPVEHGSIMAGFSHPFFGLDHILAMVAVGLWATMLGGRSLWLVPSTFVAAMAIGFALSLAGVTLPMVEPIVAASIIVLGALIAAAIRLPALPSMGIVSLFAIMHGHAHGGELGAAGALAFAVGFAAATAALHGAGIGIGLMVGSSRPVLTRAAGGAMALIGLAIMAG